MPTHSEVWKTTEKYDQLCNKRSVNNPKAMENQALKYYNSQMWNNTRGSKLDNDNTIEK